MKKGKKLFEALNFDERIARFMELKKEKGYWQHPSEFAISESLGFKNDWQWLMPVVEKIQRNYRRYVNIREYENNGWGISASITIFDQNQYNYYWCDFESIRKEIEKHTKEAAKYGEKYDDESHVIVESKFMGLYCCVCKFIEWWEKQDQ